jgi:O-antigen/teichoic acid export membrane protein
MLTNEAKPPRTRRTAAISFAAAVLAAVFSALELHGWHIYIGLAVVLITALYGFARWRQKYRKSG